MSVTVNMKELLEAGVHYGHQTRRWNPKMSQYIFCARNGIHVIDLQKTVKMFQKACNFLETATARGGHVLFVGTKRLARDIVKEQAERAGMYYINHRWLGGLLTNHATIKKSIHRLNVLERMANEGTFSKFTKKEVLGFTREQEKLERNLGGIKTMPGLPSAIFIVDAHREQIAIQEAQRLRIPVVAITDTNCDPTRVQYPIPGNDDSVKSITLFVSIAAEACIAGRSQSQAKEDDDSKPEISEGSFHDDKGNKIAVEKKG